MMILLGDPQIYLGIILLVSAANIIAHAVKPYGEMILDLPCTVWGGILILLTVWCGYTYGGTNTLEYLALAMIPSAVTVALGAVEYEHTEAVFFGRTALLIAWFVYAGSIPELYLAEETALFGYFLVTHYAMTYVSMFFTFSEDFEGNIRYKMTGVKVLASILMGLIGILGMVGVYLTETDYVPLLYGYSVYLLVALFIHGYIKGSDPYSSSRLCMLFWIANGSFYLVKWLAGGTLEIHWVLLLAIPIINSISLVDYPDSTVTSAVWLISFLGFVLFAVAGFVSFAEEFNAYHELEAFYACAMGAYASLCLFLACTRATPGEVDLYLHPYLYGHQETE